HPHDPSVPAAVLYRDVNVRFSYQESRGFQIVTAVHERVKIYSKEGFDYATVTEKLYKNGSDRESLLGLKAYTYSLANGEIAEHKLNKSNVFSTNAHAYYDEEKFTLPNVQEGSVIEYEYRKSSPFFSIDEIDLQYDIPIKRQTVTIAVPEYFYFKPNMKGYLPVAPKYKSSTGKITFHQKRRSQASGLSARQTSYSSSNVTYRIDESIYDMVDVPALNGEPYVNDMDNYRSAVNYELQYTQFPQSPREDYAGTWEKVIKTIYDSQGFGDQLNHTRYFRDDMESLLAGKTDESEKIMAIFRFVQQRMNWNGLGGYYTDKGVKDAYDERSGNIADINLMLVAMLREAGLVAKPVLISTRDNGVPIYPTREGFNYVAASVEMGGETVLLDATDKFSDLGLLPTRALNWFGKIVGDDHSFESISLFPTKPSRETVMMSAELKADGSLLGKMRNSYADYKAFSFRNENADLSEEDYLDKLENNHDGMEITEYSVQGKKDIGRPIMENIEFQLENQADVIGDNIYFSPLFQLALTQNPFTLEERIYPIDFVYPWQDRYMISIAIPAGYEISSKPEDINLMLRDNMGSFMYQTVEKVGSLQVLVDFKINSAVFSSQYYPEIKELFKKVVEKETEKVVLSKIASDGHSDSAAGSK
ncbi:MAG: DUF3857 domain-containing transglutaminase family protein, partial [Pricia sp.]